MSMVRNSTYIIHIGRIPHTQKIADQNIIGTFGTLDPSTVNPAGSLRPKNTKSSVKVYVRLPNPNCRPVCTFTGSPLLRITYLNSLVQILTLSKSMRMKKGKQKGKYKIKFHSSFNASINVQFINYRFAHSAHNNHRTKPQ